ELEAKALRSADIRFDLTTVTGTENVMMAAVLARGRTVLRHAATEPEVVDLATALTAMGGRIQGAGTPEIVIDGVEGLRPLVPEVIADRIEAGTLMVAAAVTGGEVTLRRCPPALLTPVSDVLRESGATIEPAGDGLRIRGPAGRPKPIELRTEPHPGFPTD